MTRDEERMELIREIFLKRKVKEVLTITLLICAVYGLFFLIGSISLQLGFNISKVENVFVEGVIISLLLILTGLIIYFFSYLIFQLLKFWIENNLEEAEEQADILLKKKYSKKMKGGNRKR